MNAKDAVKHIASTMLYPVRNQFILFDLKRRAEKNRVNLNYWNKVNNLGDMLSPIIVEAMLEKKNLSLDSIVKNRSHLFAIGSILTSGIQDGCVWGSGIRNTHDCYRLSNRLLDIRLVRGPLTRIVLQEYGYTVPEKYADPAVLLSCFYKPKGCNKKYKYGVILHTAHYQWKIQEKIKSTALEINILTDDYKAFVDKILSCETIISSSLHGVIIAETYGVPAVLLHPPGDIFKYCDWYYSTDRISFPIADSIEEAIDMDIPEVPDLKKLQQNAFDSFPYDLWNN